MERRDQTVPAQSASTKGATLLRSALSPKDNFTKLAKSAREEQTETAQLFFKGPRLNNRIGDWKYH